MLSYYLRAIRKRRLIPTTPRSTNFFVLDWHCRPTCFLWQLSAHSRTRGRVPFRVSAVLQKFFIQLKPLLFASIPVFSALEFDIDEQAMSVLFVVVDGV
uniref:Uncharacterized protein n=1 Tax=Parascaris equorum TaxID=6256 RepID=A0A914RXC7_PAREQ